jgi:hypothetical protein
MRNDLYIPSIPCRKKNVKVFAKKNYIFFVFLRVSEEPVSGAYGYGCYFRLFQNFGFEETGFDYPATYKNSRFATYGAKMARAGTPFYSHKTMETNSCANCPSAET